MEESKTQVEGRDFSKDQFDRCRKMLPMILSLIASKDLPVGVMGKLDTIDQSAYDVIAKEVIQLMFDNGANYIDRNNLFKLLMLPIQIISEKVVANLDISFSMASDKVWKKDIYDLSLSDIDVVLKTHDKVTGDA